MRKRREPNVATYSFKIAPSIYLRLYELDRRSREEINDYLRAFLESLLENQSLEIEKREINVNLMIKRDVEVSSQSDILKILDKLEKCQADLADYKMKAIELGEELQKKEKELGELRSKVDQKQLEELQKQLALLKSELSNLSELSLALYYCLQNGDCDISQVRATALLRLKLRSLPEPPKLYALLKVRS